VTADDDGLVPAGHESGDVRDDDRLAEDDSTDDVSDGAVGAAPHFLQAKLFHAGLIGGDGRTLHAHTVLDDGVCGVDRDLVVGFVTLLDAEVVVLQGEVKIWVNQAFLDELPDDARHFVAVEFDNDSVNLNFLHV